METEIKRLVLLQKKKTQFDASCTYLHPGTFMAALR